VAAHFNAARAFGKRYWPPVMSWAHPHTASDFDDNSGAPIPAAPKLPSEGWSDPARFCWNLNTRRAGGRRSGGSGRMRPHDLQNRM
jgi:hypothetical protein